MFDNDLPFTIYDLTNRRFDELTNFLIDYWLLTTGFFGWGFET
jgi:hypothetical protein